MFIKYFADDGTEFNDEYECEMYEESKNMKNAYPEIFKIEFWNKDSKKYSIDPDNIFDDNIYNNACKINIPSENAFLCFHDWAEYCGWCEFIDDISGPGMWKRYEKGYMNHIWVLVEKES